MMELGGSAMTKQTAQTIQTTEKKAIFELAPAVLAMISGRLGASTEGPNK
jgi:hypothetical protein